MTIFYAIFHIKKKSVLFTGLDGNRVSDNAVCFQNVLVILFLTANIQVLPLLYFTKKEIDVNFQPIFDGFIVPAQKFNKSPCYLRWENTQR